MKNRLLSLLLRLFKRLTKLATEQIYASYRKTYSLSSSFKFNGAEIQFYGDGRIEIGDHTYIGRNSTIQAIKDCSVVIGRHCAISHYVKIYTSSYEVDQDFCKTERRTKSGSVKIGNGVWIGANVLINPGISIGDNSVVGANSVVVKDVEPNSVVSGVPAVFLRYKKEG